MVSRRKVLQLVSGASATALAGCFGGGSSPEDEGSNGNATTDPPGIQRTTVPLENIGTSTAERRFPDWNWDQLEEAELQETDTVTVTQDQTFEPMLIRVGVGTTVTWESEARAFDWVIIPKVDFEKSLSRGGTVEYTFEEPGRYNYLCRQHSGHIGRVIVDETLTPGSGGGETDTGTGTADGGTDTSADGGTATDDGTASTDAGTETASGTTADGS